jgi:hypothetical protein
MRFLIAGLFVCGLFLGNVTVPTLAASDGAYALAEAQQPPSGQLEVDINTNEGGAWYTSPMWIAIGVIALVLLILLVVVAARGGGTTVIKE